MNRTKRRRPKPARKASRPASNPPDAGSQRGLKIGEAAKVIGVEAYVLRFWETQFPILKPKHARSKHRFYQPADIETLKLIKRLLHLEGFTIVGANKFIRENGVDASKIVKHPAQASEKTPTGGIEGPARRALAEVRRDLESIHKLLEE